MRFVRRKPSEKQEKDGKEEQEVKEEVANRMMISLFGSSLQVYDYVSSGILNYQIHWQLSAGLDLKISTHTHTHPVIHDASEFCRQLFAVGLHCLLFNYTKLNGNYKLANNTRLLSRSNARALSKENIRFFFFFFYFITEYEGVNHMANVYAQRPINATPHCCIAHSYTLTHSTQRRNKNKEEGKKKILIRLLADLLQPYYYYQFLCVSLLLFFAYSVYVHNSLCCCVCGSTVIILFYDGCC